MNQTAVSASRFEMMRRPLTLLVAAKKVSLSEPLDVSSNELATQPQNFG
ncbi:hypothetical protein [Mesorhizobium carmichaelinearum]|nr:hypothetical protein [Mesorhizobium carmichaelinearum]